MGMEKARQGYDFSNVLGKLPEETDEEQLKRTGQEVTPATAEELRGNVEHGEVVDRLSQLQEESGK